MIYPPDYSSGGLLFVLDLFLIICIITVVGIASSNTFNIKNAISFIILVYSFRFLLNYTSNWCCRFDSDYGVDLSSCLIALSIS